MPRFYAVYKHCWPLSSGLKHEPSQPLWVLWPAFSLLVCDFVSSLCMFPSARKSWRLNAIMLCVFRNVSHVSENVFMPNDNTRSSWTECDFNFIRIQSQRAHVTLRLLWTLHWKWILSFFFIIFRDRDIGESLLTSNFTVLLISARVNPYSPAEWWNNCGVYGKSTKCGQEPMIVYDIVNHTGYGPHRHLSHNFKYGIFNFLHQDSSMETRLPQTVPN